MPLMMTIPSYGSGKSERIEKILAEQWEAIEEYLFGKVDKQSQSLEPALRNATSLRSVLSDK